MHFKIFYVASFPRSGNTWVRMMLTEILDPVVLDANPVFESTASGPARFQLPDPIPASSMIKTHGKYSSCFPHIPKIYLLRDGRDAMHSYYHFNVKHRDYTESWESYFERHVTRRQMKDFRESFLDGWMGDWSENVLSYLEREDVLIIRYEDLRSDPVKELAGILSFVGYGHFDLSIIAATVQRHEEKLLEKNSKSTRIRGGMEAWKSIYTLEQRAAFDLRHGKALLAAGYELGSG